MHTHYIDLELPLGLGHLKAQIDHKPLDADNILVIVAPETLPKLASIIPRRDRMKARQFVVKRTLVREWGEKLLAWADEPTGEADL